MTRDMNQLQAYFLNKATEKARLRNVLVNGNKATVIFSEYKAPDSDVNEFREYDGSDGHYFYITFCVWSGCKSYWTDKDISVAYKYITTKTEGNEIYKTIKATGKFEIQE